jgi:hypothetical protein
MSVVVGLFPSKLRPFQWIEPNTLTLAAANAEFLTNVLRFMMGWGLYQEVNHILDNSPQPLNISWLQLGRRKKMQSTLLIKRHHRRILNPFAGSLPIRCRKLLIGVDTYNSGTIGNGHSFVSNWAQYSASFRIIALSASVISITKVAAVESTLRKNVFYQNYA